MKLPAPWTEFDIPVSEAYFVRIGEVGLWFRSSNDELWTSRIIEEGKEHIGPEESAPSVSAKWKRWVTRSEIKKIRIAPAPPDRPLVIIPKEQFHLQPGAQAKVFVQLPAWLRMETLSEKLTEMPSVPLPDTWFGTTMQGELCFELKSQLMRKTSELKRNAHFIACPISLTNDSDDSLSVERICLRAQHLTLYVADELLWSDELSITYNGIGEASEIKFSSAPPANITNAVKICGPRIKPRQGFMAHTFSSLLDLVGLT